MTNTKRKIHILLLFFTLFFLLLFLLILKSISLVELLVSLSKASEIFSNYSTFVSVTVASKDWSTLVDKRELKKFDISELSYNFSNDY